MSDLNRKAGPAMVEALYAKGLLAQLLNGQHGALTSEVETIVERVAMRVERSLAALRAHDCGDPP